MDVRRRLAVFGAASFFPAIPYFLQRWQHEIDKFPAAAPPHAMAILFTGELVKFVVLSALAAWAGARFAPRLNLALAPNLRRETILRVVALGLGAALVSTLMLKWLAPQALPHAVLGDVSRARAVLLILSTVPVLATVELLCRWGLLTATAWALVAARLPSLAAFWVANLLAALLVAGVALLHFEMPTSAKAMVVLAMMVPSLCYGVIFRRYGLVAAMIAHSTSVVVSAVVAAC